MSKFKAGDKVRCIDADNSRGLEEGQTYEVLDTLESIAGKHWVTLNTRVNYLAYRFELAEDVPKFNVGDKVLPWGDDVKAARTVRDIHTMPDGRRYCILYNNDDPAAYPWITEEADLEPYEPPTQALGDLEVGDQFKIGQWTVTNTLENKGITSDGRPFVISSRSTDMHLKVRYGDELTREVKKVEEGCDE